MRDEPALARLIAGKRSQPGPTLILFKWRWLETRMFAATLLIAPAPF